MEKPCLNDENEYPDDDVLSRYLGDVKKTWDSFIDFINVSYPAFSGEWRYYKDGNNWLYKITKKKKTICWVSVWHNLFKTTFYFPGRAEELILNSKIRVDLIDQFMHSTWYGKTRGFTVDIKNEGDLDTTKLLIEIKEELK
ncbi:DUF3788 family protein [candidate division KSB1 bacterium]|nr:DUF3788 family protein [candidate division KSB1 bacterium]